MSERPKEIEQLRKDMRTFPDVAPREDKIYFDLHHLKVEIVDKPVNPYKAIYTLVTSTWGSRSRWWHRWEEATPEGRMSVVEAALQGKTLPAALECPSFTFKIQGMSRSAYDQLARERYSGVGSMGMRDDAHLDAALVLPQKLMKYAGDIETWWRLTKDLYQKIVQVGKESWQTGRFLLPMGVEWRFTWTLNYRALQSMLAKRLCFSEQFDTVAVAWKIWDELRLTFPLLAAYCLPACDKAHRCLYSEAYSLSELFGNLFLPCGRWPSTEKPYAIFNEASTTKEEIMKITGICIPKPEDWSFILEEARRKDRRFFIEKGEASAPRKLKLYKCPYCGEAIEGYNDFMVHKLGCRKKRADD